MQTAPGQAGDGVQVRHGLIQQGEGHPVWRVLEACHIQDENEVEAAVVAADRTEVAIARLLEAAARVADHEVLLAAAAYVQDLLPELGLGEGAVTSHVDLGAVAAGKAGSLLSGVGFRGNLWQKAVMITDATLHTTSPIIHLAEGNALLLHFFKGTVQF